jgi:hypothetical protein
LQSFFELWELSVHANAITLYRKKDVNAIFFIYPNVQGTKAESNEDYGMLFRLSQEGGITYINLIQQVSVSPNANLAGAEVVVSRKNKTHIK